MKRLRRIARNNREEAQAMLAILVVLATVMLLIPIGVIALVNGQSSVTSLGKNSESALQAAEAGIADYENHLISYYTSSGGYGSSYCSDGTFGTATCNGKTVPGSSNPGFVANLDGTTNVVTNVQDTHTCDSPSNSWALLTGDSAEYHTGYQYVVNSSGVATAPFTVYVYATGHAGTPGRMTCVSVKAAIDDHEGAQVDNKNISSCGSSLETATDPTSPVAQTMTVDLDGAQGATGGGTITQAGALGGNGQQLEVTFPSVNGASIGVIVGCGGTLGKAGLGFANGGGAYNGGGGGSASAVCFEGTLTDAQQVCAPNEPATCPSGSADWPGTFDNNFPCTGPAPSGTPECGSAWPPTTVPCVLAVAAGGGGGGEGRCAGDTAGAGGDGGGAVNNTSISLTSGDPYYDPGTTSSTVSSGKHGGVGNGLGGGYDQPVGNTTVPGDGGTGGAGAGNPRPNGNPGDGPGPYNATDTPFSAQPGLNYTIATPSGFGGLGTGQNSAGGMSGAGGGGWTGGGSGGAAKACGGGGGGGGGETMISPAAIASDGAIVCTNPTTVSKGCPISTTYGGGGGNGFLNVTWNSVNLGTASLSTPNDTCPTSNAAITNSTQVPSSAQSMQVILAGASGASGGDAVDGPGVGGKGDEVAETLSTSSLPLSSLPWLEAVTGCAGQSQSSSNAGAGGAGFTSGGSGGTGGTTFGGGGGGSSGLCLSSSASGTCSTSLPQCTSTSTSNCVLAVAGGGGGGGESCLATGNASGGSGGTPEINPGTGLGGGSTGGGNIPGVGGGGGSLTNPGAGGGYGAKGGSAGTNGDTSATGAGGAGGNSAAAAKSGGGGGGGGWHGGGGGGSGGDNGNSACSSTKKASGAGGGGAGSSLATSFSVANSTWSSASITTTGNFLTSGVTTGMTLSGAGIAGGPTVASVTATTLTVSGGTITGSNTGTLTFTAPALLTATSGYGDGSIAIKWSLDTSFSSANIFPSYGDDCGDTQTFEVPTGTTDITVNVSGGSGTPFGSTIGGYGANISGVDLTNGTSGSPLTQFVSAVLGCNGSLAITGAGAGSGGAGTQDTGSDYSGGGGGASAVCVGQFCNLTGLPLNTGSYIVSGNAYFGADTTAGGPPSPTYVATPQTDTPPCPASANLSNEFLGGGLGGDGNYHSYYGCVAVVAGGGGGAGSGGSATGGSAGVAGLTTVGGAGTAAAGANGAGTNAGAGGSIVGNSPLCSGAVSGAPAKSENGCVNSYGDGGGGYDPYTGGCAIAVTGCVAGYGGGGASYSGSSGGGGGASFVSALANSVTSANANSSSPSISITFSVGKLQSQAQNFGCNGLETIQAPESGTAGVTTQGGSGSNGGSNPQPPALADGVQLQQGLGAQITASFGVTAGEFIGIVFGCPGINTGDPANPRTGQGFTTQNQVAAGSPSYSGGVGGENGGNGGGSGAVCLFDAKNDATLANCNSSTPGCPTTPALTSSNPSCVVFVAGGGGGGGAKTGQGNAPKDGFGGYAGGTGCSSYSTTNCTASSLTYTGYSCGPGTSNPSCAATVFPGQEGSLGTAGNGGQGGGGSAGTCVSPSHSSTAIGCNGTTAAGDSGAGGGGFDPNNNDGGGGGGVASTKGGYGAGGGGGASYISSVVTAVSFTYSDANGVQQQSGEQSKVDITASTVSVLASQPTGYNNTTW